MSESIVPKDGCNPSNAFGVHANPVEKNGVSPELRYYDPKAMELGGKKPTASDQFEGFDGGPN